MTYPLFESLSIVILFLLCIATILVLIVGIGVLIGLIINWWRTR